MSLINDNLEINIGIIDVNNNNLILKEPYTEKLANLTQIPITIAEDITTKLGHRLSDVEKIRMKKNESKNSEAYQNYLMGRFHWNKRSPEGFQQAIECFHRAISQDSGFALAHAGLADAYILLPQYSGIFLSDVWDKATYSARKALNLDPNLSEARMAYANILLNEWKWEEARKEIEYAIELDPQNSFAHFMHGMFLIIVGDMNEAISKLKTALNLDPLSIVANRTLGTAYTILLKSDEAIEQFEKTVVIAPDDFNSYLSLAGIYLENGNLEKSLFYIQKYYSLLNFINLDEIIETTFPDGNFQMHQLPQLFTHLQREIQRTRHPILSKPGSRFTYFALSGQADSLFTMMNKAIDSREFVIVTLLRYPILDPFRSDPRFQKVLERVHLDQYQ
jgi:serine/threonine-protein kinase